MGRTECRCRTRPLALHAAHDYPDAMNAPTATCWTYLEPRPGFLRQLWIKGKAVTARDVYGLHVNAEDPMTIAELAADFDLPVTAVEEAVAYCRTKPKEIEQDFLREQALLDACGMNDPHYN